MGVTRLKRKGRRNKQRAAQRQAKIKFLTTTPVLKNVDKEELKATFTAEEPKKSAKAKKEESPKAEVSETAAQEEAPAKKKAKAAKVEETKEEENSVE